MKNYEFSSFSDFKEWSVCVLIPTYNNEQTLEAVINDVSRFTDQIIIVNDGSTDSTKEILNNYDHFHIIDYVKNRGKGHALKIGFRAAWELGYEYAITIDSDGQHFAEDLPVFLQAIKDHPRSLIIGARNMNQEHVPQKSSFGNKFSNFWFWVETGIKLPDTQSGYRVYPLKETANKKYYTRKYEFEIEAPIRLAWSGVNILAIPIQVYYPPPGKRVSHFRPFKDFTRISILNTFLTFIALFWIHPRDFLKKISKKEGWKDIYQKAFFDPKESLQTKAKSISFGIFMGIVPVWGFQLAIGIPLAIYFKMNKALFLIAANISVFPITPIIWALSLWVGKIILGYEEWSLRFKDISLEQFKEAGIAFFLGGTVLAMICGFIAYLLSIFYFKSKNKQA